MRAGSSVLQFTKNDPIAGSNLISARWLSDRALILAEIELSRKKPPLGAAFRVSALGGLPRRSAIYSVILLTGSREPL